MIKNNETSDRGIDSPVFWARVEIRAIGVMWRQSQQCNIHTSPRCSTPEFCTLLSRQHLATKQPNTDCRWTQSGSGNWKYYNFGCHMGSTIRIIVTVAFSVSTVIFSHVILSIACKKLKYWSPSCCSSRKSSVYPLDKVTRISLFASCRHAVHTSSWWLYPGVPVWEWFNRMNPCTINVGSTPLSLLCLLLSLLLLLLVHCFVRQNNTTTNL